MKHTGEMSFGEKNKFLFYQFPYSLELAMLRLKKYLFSKYLISISKCLLMIGMVWRVGVQETAGHMPPYGALNQGGRAVSRRKQKVCSFEKSFQRNVYSFAWAKLISRETWPCLSEFYHL